VLDPHIRCSKGENIPLAMHYSLNICSKAMYRKKALIASVPNFKISFEKYKNLCEK
jgi:hypothetical protein